MRMGVVEENIHFYLMLGSDSQSQMEGEVEERGFRLQWQLPVYNTVSASLWVASKAVWPCVHVCGHQRIWQENHCSVIGPR